MEHGSVLSLLCATWQLEPSKTLALTLPPRPLNVQSIHMLRHGCLPVVVLDGESPGEKRDAQRARYAARFGRAGGGRGGVPWQAMSDTVGRVLEAMVRRCARCAPSRQKTLCASAAASLPRRLCCWPLLVYRVPRCSRPPLTSGPLIAPAQGLPVIRAPGEAEALCAALARAGAVDAVVTRDADALLHGAETVYPTFSLSTTAPRKAELERCSLSDARAALGIGAGGAAALGVLAALAGCDYLPSGTAGVGARGALAVVRHLLEGQPDDSQLFPALEALRLRPPDAGLAAARACTGCRTCGHEGRRKGRIERHSARNPCRCCPPGQVRPRGRAAAVLFMSL